MDSTVSLAAVWTLSRSSSSDSRDSFQSAGFEAPKPLPPLCACCGLLNLTLVHGLMSKFEPYWLLLRHSSLRLQGFAVIQGFDGIIFRDRI
jgi:hypothetical protein